MFTNMLFCCVYCSITFRYPINQLCAQICPYHNVLPGAVYCCFNKNYKVLNMTLHAGLENPTSLQSFMVWYCSVCELHCLNSKKKEKMNFGTYGRIGTFYLLYARMYMIFWSVV